MVVILDDNVKWNSNHDDMEIFQDTFILGIMR